MQYTTCWPSALTVVASWYRNSYHFKIYILLSLSLFFLRLFFCRINGGQGYGTDAAVRYCDGGRATNEGHEHHARPYGQYVSLFLRFSLSLSLSLFLSISMHTLQPFMREHLSSADIARIPQGGRNFESFGEDPTLAAKMAYASITGIQVSFSLSLSVCICMVCMCVCVCLWR